MTRGRAFLERLRHTFWVLPAVAIALAFGLGIGLTSIDATVSLPEVISFDGDAATARALLQAVIALAVSIAGISFSVIVVALVLASQQLSPRVLRNFQRNPLNQLVLGVFLGTAIYTLCVLFAVGEGSGGEVPELSTSLAVVFAAASLVLFVFFVHHALRSLNASAVIKRIAADGRQAVKSPYPGGAGEDARDEADAERRVAKLTESLPREEVAAPRAGYLATVEAAEILRVASRADGFVEQRIVIGDFVVTGATLAVVWAPRDAIEELSNKIEGVFVLSDERTIDHDMAFPVRQLADIALKGLSPGINDPTTSENAMDSLTDALVVASHEDWGTALRLDADDEPRLRINRPSFDDVVRLGFDQVRRDGASRPSFSVRLLELLATLRDLGGPVASGSKEIDRQAALIRQQAGDLADTDADHRLIEDAFRRLHERDVREPAGVV